MRTVTHSLNPWAEAQGEETEYVLTITTTNPDLKDRVVRAFDRVGLDRSPRCTERQVG